jgi:hypothetical protein
MRTMVDRLPFPNLRLPWKPAAPSHQCMLRCETPLTPPFTSHWADLQPCRNCQSYWPSAA